MSISPSERKFQVGDLCEVSSRTWPGINKPGGAGKITKVNGDGTYNVHYVVMGGTERSVEAKYIRVAQLEAGPRIPKERDLFINYTQPPARRTSSLRKSGRPYSPPPSCDSRKQSPRPMPVKLVFSPSTSVSESCAFEDSRVDSPTPSKSSIESVDGEQLTIESPDCSEPVSQEQEQAAPDLVESRRSGEIDLNAWRPIKRIQLEKTARMSLSESHHVERQNLANSFCVEQDRLFRVFLGRREPALKLSDMEHATMIESFEKQRDAMINTQIARSNVLYQRQVEELSTGLLPPPRVHVSFPYTFS